MKAPSPKAASQYGPTMNSWFLNLGDDLACTIYNRIAKQERSWRGDAAGTQRNKSPLPGGRASAANAKAKAPAALAAAR